MASIRREIHVHSHPDQVWDAARDVGALHTRLVPGFVVDTRLEAGIRHVHFADGSHLLERIVAIDDGSRRVVWSVVGEPFVHHNGALELHADGPGTRVVWTADLLPDVLAGPVAMLMEQGLAVMKRTLETNA